MVQTDIFDWMASQQLKTSGMEQAQYGSIDAADWVQRAREVALVLAAKQGDVNINQVLQLCPRPSSVSANATGSIFRDKRFRRVGFLGSDKVSARARMISVWALA